MLDNRGKLTLEDLLKAKRKEQPEPEFWTRFDREFKGKQKLLIQRQLVNETRLKAPLATRFYKIGAFTATCGIAAFAVYLGFQTPLDDSSSELSAKAATPAPSSQTPSFSVASKTDNPSRPGQSSGLQEFASLARTSTPRIVVRESAREAQSPTPTQISAIETLASLESTIRANRASGPAPTPSYQFVSSTGLFEKELVESDNAPIEGVWDFESAYMLGKYADPLTGGLNTSNQRRSINRVQPVNLSQLDDAISSQGTRNSRSLDALTVRF